MKEFKLDEKNKIKAPFKVPEGYFDTLNQEILDKTVEKKEGKQVHFSFGTIAKVAASILLVAVTFFYFNNKDNSPEQSAEDILAEVSAEDIIEYLAENDISEMEIMNEIDNDFSFEPEDALNDVDLDNADLEDFIYDIEINDNI